MDRNKTDRRRIQIKEYAEKFAATVKDDTARKQAAVSVAKGLLCSLCAFLLGRGSFLFGCYPFGIAFLTASSQNLWYILLGCTAASFFVPDITPFLYIAVYCLLLAIRLRLTYFYKEKEGAKEPIGMRIALSVILSFIPGVYRCISEDFSLYALLSLLFTMLFSGVFTLLYLGAFIGGEVLSLHKRAAYAALMFSLVYAVKDLTLFGFSPSVALAAFFVLLCAQNEDYLSCGMLGLILGIACGKDYAPILALVGLISAAFGKYSKKTAPWTGILAGFAWAFYSKGSSAFLYVLPDLVCGGMLSLPLSIYFERTKKQNDAFKKSLTPKERENEKDVSKNLKDLSNRIRAFSEKMRTPSEDAARRIVYNCAEDICRNCENKCFENTDNAEKLSSYLFETGSLDGQTAIPRECKKATLFCDVVKNEYSSELRHLGDSDRANDYSVCLTGISKLLLDREKAKKEEEESRLKYKKDFERAINKLFQNAGNFSAKGKRRIFLSCEGIDPGAFEKDAENYRNSIEKYCGFKLSEHCFENSNGKVRLIFEVLPQFHAEMGAVTRVKEDETCSGDSIYSFTFDNCFYAFLCDGMGSGRDASLVSGIACSFIENLIKSGAEMKTVIEMLNGFLLAQNCECPTTLDLLRLDLLTLKADFIKCGSCPSLVLRGTNTFKIASASLPIGGAKQIFYEAVTVKLKPEDTVIMISDGISEEIEGSSWLSDLLAGKLSDVPQTLAEDILRSSDKGQKKNDDKSVIVLKIKENGGNGKAVG